MYDAIERAHLKDSSGFSPPVHRAEVLPELSDLVRRHWTPVWELKPGQVTVQRVLRYPVCLVTIAPDSASFLGPAAGLSTKELSGSGWTAGLMLQPAAGWLLTGRPVSEWLDREVDLIELEERFATTVSAVREVMNPDPTNPVALDQARSFLEAALLDVEVDDEGRRVNAIVETLETDPAYARVAQVCTEYAISERGLQRLFAKRVGLSPKWVIQRRRLWDAVGSLRDAERGDLADIAASLGYTDQSHFTRDFRTVVGLTPGQFLAEQRSAPGPRPDDSTH